ncbi:cell division protein FtsL [Kiloniella laminariae]|uniref:cell division protein FtsL n=1 Tax=Kiloniella laminariae TaxID=454162 RepID=UPI0003612C3C|nr:hypothetical protein [Kiloniella laminariae]
MKNLGIIIWIVAGTACAIVLFQVKQDVTDLELQLAVVERKIANDKEAIRILQAEWSYLNQPDRLEKLATRYLDLKPLSSGQIVTFDDLPRPGEEASQSTGISSSGTATLTSGEIYE